NADADIDPLGAASSCIGGGSLYACEGGGRSYGRTIAGTARDKSNNSISKAAVRQIYHAEPDLHASGSRETRKPRFGCIHEYSTSCSVGRGSKTSRGNSIWTI